MRDKAVKAVADQQYEYWTYRSFKATVNHHYLWPAVLAELQRVTRPPVRLLDAGCGTGAFCERLHEHFGFEVYGCDLSDSGIVLARKNAPACRFEEVSLYDDLAKSFGVRFEVVVSLEVIEHLYDPVTFVTRVREVLTPEGIFVLTTPYHGYLKNFMIAASGRCDSHYNPMSKGGHIKFWSKRTIVKLLESDRFRVERISGVGRVPWL